MEIPDGAGGVLNVTCVVVREMNLSMGCNAVEWRLLTNLIATVIANAVEPIDWYRCRWEIEIFFKRPQKLLPC